MLYIPPRQNKKANICPYCMAIVEIPIIPYQTSHFLKLSSPFDHVRTHCEIFVPSFIKHPVVSLIEIFRIVADKSGKILGLRFLRMVRPFSILVEHPWLWRKVLEIDSNV